MNVDPDRTCASFKGSDLEGEDYEEWRNWRVDDSQPNSCNNRDAHGGQVTAFLLDSEIRVALWSLNENMGRKSPSTSPSVTRRRERITLLEQGMSKKSSSWAKGRAKDKRWWTEDRGTDGNSQCSQEKCEPAASSYQQPNVK